MLMRGWIFKLLFAVCCAGLIMGGEIECEWDDDKLEIDLDDRVLPPPSDSPFLTIAP
jgi:hypothetical protein